MTRDEEKLWDKAFNAGIEAAAKAIGDDPVLEGPCPPEMYEAVQKYGLEFVLRAGAVASRDSYLKLLHALSKPIPQEPAERESGK
jgi:hypothetical protein